MATKRQKRSRARARSQAPPAAADPRPEPPPTSADPPRRTFLGAAREAYREGIEEKGPARRRRPLTKLLDDRPQPLWGSAPISEIVVVVGAIVLVISLFRGPAEGEGGIVIGIGLCLLAVLEFTVREHFSGFRSHSLVLALLLTAGIHTIVVYVLRLPVAAVAAIDVFAFALIALSMRSIFDQRKVARGS
ncbi:MAG: hypothetical protein H0U42_00710 [Thermoleophilaceae bacterium]|nr:hypothetical protein [Thermoleophilaceae bacterium]